MIKFKALRERDPKAFLHLKLKLLLTCYKSGQFFCTLFELLERVDGGMKKSLLSTHKNMALGSEQLGPNPSFPLTECANAN